MARGTGGFRPVVSGLGRWYEVRGWWRADCRGPGPPGERATAGRAAVRAGRGRPPDREDLAGEHEVGVAVAAGLGAAGGAALASRGPGGRGFGVAQIAVLDSPAPVAPGRRPPGPTSRLTAPSVRTPRRAAAARPVPSTGLLQVKRRGPCLPAAIAERLRAVRPGCSPPPRSHETPAFTQVPRGRRARRRVHARGRLPALFQVESGIDGPAGRDLTHHWPTRASQAPQRRQAGAAAYAWLRQPARSTGCRRIGSPAGQLPRRGGCLDAMVLAGWVSWSGRPGPGW
jgi:hypothetical protein